MENSRVSKYKNYRDSFIREEAIEFGEPNKNREKPFQTLSLDEVMKHESIKDQKIGFDKKKKTKKILKIVCICLGILLIIAGLIIWAIFAF